MKRKIVAFGASNSRQSINKKLAEFAARQVADASVNLLDLNDYEMPIYSIDREKASDFPDLAKRFIEDIREADGIIISFAEHNGAYTVAFKNIFDWVSRIERNIWADKPMLLLSTSPGGRGGKSVLGMATSNFRFMNKNTVVASFSLPSFGKNFDPENGITDAELSRSFREQLNLFVEAL